MSATARQRLLTLETYGSFQHMTIYLYVKTHRVTKLKYFGKTVRDPYKYRGSGKHWKAHLKVHGYDIDTTIIGEYENVEEAKIDSKSLIVSPSPKPLISGHDQTHQKKIADVEDEEPKAEDDL